MNLPCRKRFNINPPTKGQIDNKQVAVINKASNSSKPYKKPRRTKGRKKAVYATHFEHNGEWLEVNANENMGFYPVMMEAFIKQLDIAYSIHNRLLVVRFDLHQKDHYTEDSKMITDFFERVKRKLETHYNGLHSIGHIWVREHEKAKAQHYHCSLFLDYDLVCNPKVTGDKIRQTWGSLREGNTVHIVKGSHKVNDDLSRAEAIYHISYLSKERGKGRRPSE
ncbi:putative Inovirus Gp2 family protein [uncultured Thiomicrorhabdus sp.]